VSARWTRGLCDTYFTIMPGTSEPTDAWITVPGGELYVRVWQPRAGEERAPILLLHDSLGCVDMWRSFPPALAAATGRAVIAYDRLGFGRSSPRDRPATRAFIEEEATIYLPALLRSLQLHRCVLFGHSVGGAMAVTAAARARGEYLAVVTESAQAFVEDQTRMGILRAKAAFAEPAARQRLERYHGDKTRWVLSGWIDVWLSPEFADWNLEDVLPQVRCPLLVLHGDRDEYGSQQFPDTFRRLAGGEAESVIIRDCGHVPHREQQDVVLAEVARFLGRVD
jgi:pimeloyl-ACP methyl ester carboxylesterase